MRKTHPRFHDKSCDASQTKGLEHKAHAMTFGERPHGKSAPYAHGDRRLAG